MTSTQGYSECLEHPPPCPKGKPQSERPEHQKFIEHSAFPKAQLATPMRVVEGREWAVSQSCSPGPDQSEQQEDTPEPGWGRRTQRGEENSLKVEASVWKSHVPSTMGEECVEQMGP